MRSLATSADAAATQAAQPHDARTTLQTIRSLLPYLWPHGDRGSHVRVIVSVLLLVAAKIATVLVPLVYSRAVDALAPKAGAA